MEKQRKLELATDFYQLSVSNVYEAKGFKDRKAVFDVFIRRNPFEGGYSVFAGLEQVIDYINNLKPSGYRSYHLIVHYEVETVKGTTIIPVEIQIRTLGMNFWAIIEHSLQYKYNGEIPAHVKERLNAASDALITLDNEMSSIHDEIINSQTYFMVKANIVSDILSTIQNLYKVANKQVVIKIQDEFYEIFEKGDVNELSRFSRQLDIIAEDYRAQSVQ